MTRMRDSRRPKIAVFGGSFDPPHNYHLQIGLHVLKTQNIDEVWFMPVQRHVLGKQSVPFANRMAMVNALIAPHRPRLSVSDFENRSGASGYTIDLLKDLHSAYPDHRFSLVLGTDIREETDRWKNFDEIARDFPIIWIGREGHMAEISDTVLPDVSSTHIRNSLMAHQPVNDVVSPSVLMEIALRGLYEPH